MIKVKKSIFYLFLFSLSINLSSMSESTNQSKAAVDSEEKMILNQNKLLSWVNRNRKYIIPTIAAIIMVGGIAAYKLKKRSAEQEAAYKRFVNYLTNLTTDDFFREIKRIDLGIKKPTEKGAIIPDPAMWGSDYKLLEEAIKEAKSIRIEKANVRNIQKEDVNATGSSEAKEPTIKPAAIKEKPYKIAGETFKSKSDEIRLKEERFKKLAPLLLKDELNYLERARKSDEKAGSFITVGDIKQSIAKTLETKGYRLDKQTGKWININTNKAL